MSNKQILGLLKQKNYGMSKKYFLLLHNCIGTGILQSIQLLNMFKTYLSGNNVKEVPSSVSIIERPGPIISARAVRVNCVVIQFFMVSACTAFKERIVLITI